MVKAVIFDLDGILVDSEPLHFEAHKKALQKFGIELTMDDYVSFGLAKGDWDLHKKMAEKYSIAIDKEKILTLKNEIYKDIFNQKGAPRSGAMELLKNLAKSYLLAVASSGSRDNVSYVLEKFGMKQYFNVIVTGNDVENVKPFPDIYIQAKNLLGFKEDECIAIEDSETGLEAAVNAGIKCIVVPCDFTKNQDFSRAHSIFNRLEEVIIGNM